MKASKAIVLGGVTAISMAGVALAVDALGQAYPTKPISIILPFPAGSGNDTVTCIIGPKMTEELHQPVIVDNRPGAGGVVAADLASRAAPDGYTLFLSSSSVAINMHSAHAKYDMTCDFAAISVVGELPFVRAPGCGAAHEHARGGRRLPEERRRALGPHPPGHRHAPQLKIGTHTIFHHPKNRDAHAFS